MQMPAQNTPCGLNPVPLNKAKVPDAIYGRPWISHYVKVVVELVKVVHKRVQDTIDDDRGNRRRRMASEIIKLLRSPLSKRVVEIRHCTQSNLSDVEIWVEDNCEDFFHESRTHVVREQEAREQGIRTCWKVDVRLEKVIIGLEGYPSFDSVKLACTRFASPKALEIVQKGSRESSVVGTVAHGAIVVAQRSCKSRSSVRVHAHMHVTHVYFTRRITFYGRPGLTVVDVSVLLVSCCDSPDTRPELQCPPQLC